MDPDPSRVYFWPAVNKGWLVFNPDIFWPILKRFFWPKWEKNWKFWDLGGNFPNPEETDQLDQTQFDLSNKKMTQPYPFLTQIHH